MGPERARAVGAAGVKGQRKAARAAIGRLGDNVLTKRALKQFPEFARQFFARAFGGPELPRQLNLGRLDQPRAEYVEYLRGEGEPKGWAAYALAAVQRDIPSAGRRLPSAWRLKSAWGKLELPERAPPMTQGVALALAGVMIQAGHPRSAVAVSIGFHCALRTGEVLAPRRRDVAIARTGTSAIINLRLTKSGQRLNQHEMVSVDDAKLAQWLSRVFRGPSPPGGPLVAQAT